MWKQAASVHPPGEGAIRAWTSVRRAVHPDVTFHLLAA
jgi:hypothetical protein